MSLTNESKIALEIHKKPNMLYDEVDLISTNRRINKFPDSSDMVVVVPNNNSPKKYDNTIDFSNLVYGTSIDKHNPRKIGLVTALFYINKFPLIIIGPDCKKNNIFIYLIFYLMCR